MKLFFFFFTAIFAASAASEQASLDSEIPSCARSCFDGLQQSSVAQCLTLDIACICNHPESIDYLMQCLNQGCPDEQETTDMAGIFQRFCTVQTDGNGNYWVMGPLGSTTTVIENTPTPTSIDSTSVGPDPILTSLASGPIDPGGSKATPSPKSSTLRATTVAVATNGSPAKTAGPCFMAAMGAALLVF